jgi:cytochrome b561
MQIRGLFLLHVGAAIEHHFHERQPELDAWA